jgi:hypothetical protein
MGCNVLMDTHCYHALSCQKHSNTTTQRHDAMGKALCSLALASGLRARANAPMPFVGTDSKGQFHAYRPADVLIEDQLSTPLCVDVTIVSPLSAAKNGTTATKQLGWLVTNKANDKKKLYESLCSLNGHSFTPFAMDTAGIVHSDAMTLMKRLATAYARKNTCEFSYALTIVTRRISFTLQREIALQIFSSLKSLHQLG